MYQLLFTILAFIGFGSGAIAQDGYQIKVKIKDYQGQEVYLAHHYGNRLVATDTIGLNEKNEFVFSGEEGLKTGSYMIVLPPKNKKILFIIDGDQQIFSIHTDTTDFVRNTKIKGSATNKKYYEYLSFLEDQKLVLNPIKEAIESETDSLEKLKLTDQLTVLKSRKSEHQRTMLQKMGDDFLGLIIGLDIENIPPKYKGTSDEVLEKERAYRKIHYFDHIDLKDPRMMRTSRFFRKVDYYTNFLSTEGVTALTPAFADSITVHAIKVFEEVKEVKATYKYLLINFLSHYATAKVIGLDRVYVNLVEKYVKTDQAPFLTANNKKEVIRKAYAFKPILMGKKAPDIKMYLEDDTPISLHDIEAEYTILMFWRPKCGACRKAMPILLDFYEKYKKENIKIFSVCTYTGGKTEQCWPDMKEKKMEPFINTVDSKHVSRFMSKYDVRTTPKIIILDKNKQILVKSVGAVQVEDILSKLKKLGY